MSNDWATFDQQRGAPTQDTFVLFGDSETLARNIFGYVDSLIDFLAVFMNATATAKTSDFITTQRTVEVIASEYYFPFSCFRWSVGHKIRSRIVWSKLAGVLRPNSRS